MRTLEQKVTDNLVRHLADEHGVDPNRFTGDDDPHAFHEEDHAPGGERHGHHEHEHPAGCTCPELDEDPEHGGRIICGLCGMRYATAPNTACHDCA